MNEGISPDEYAAMQGGEMPQDYTQFAKFIVEDKKIPKEAKKQFWGFLSKESVLTISDQDDRRRVENRYAILRNYMLMSEPYYKIDINRLKDFQNIQHRNTVEASRSRGGFERDRLAMQIREVRTTRLDPDSNKTGFFKGVASKLGFSGKKEGELTG